jgi:hypothetical protein
MLKPTTRKISPMSTIMTIFSISSAPKKARLYSRQLITR